MTQAAEDYRIKGSYPSSSLGSLEKKRCREIARFLRKKGGDLLTIEPSSRALKEVTIDPTVLVENADLKLPKEMGKVVEKAVRPEGIRWDNKTKTWQLRKGIDL